MIEPDTLSVLLLILAMGVLVLVSGVVFDWRSATGYGTQLPLWVFLRRQGVHRDAVAARIGERALRRAEIRCAACGSRPACAARVASGAHSPAADCPNAALFADGLSRQAA